MKITVSKSIWIIVAVFISLYIYGMASSALLYSYMSRDFFKYFFLIAALFSLFIIACKLLKRGLYKEELLFFSLIIAMLLSVGMQLTFYSNAVELNEYARNAHSYLFSVTYISIFWLLIGYSIGYKEIVRKKNSLALIIVFTLFSLVVPLLNDNFILDYKAIDQSLNHLYVGDYFFILIIAAYSLSKGVSNRIIIFLSIALLFLLAGRANLLIYIISIGLYEFFLANKKSKLYYMILFLVLMFLSLVIFSMLGELIKENESVQKMLFISGIENDASYQARNVLFEKGVDNIMEQILFGDISSLIRTNGSLGSYMHNVLSFIQFYGMAAFLILIVLVAFLLLKLYRNVKSYKFRNANTDNSMVPFQSLLLISGLVGILTSKSANYVIFMFGLGVYVSVNSFQRVK